MIFLSFLFSVSIVINVVLFFVAKRFAIRAVQFDDLLENIVDDIDAFNVYMTNVLSKNIFSNSPDVMALTKNMQIMKERFEFYVMNFEKKKTRKEKQAIDDQRPVVVD